MFEYRVQQLALCVYITEYFQINIYMCKVRLEWKWLDIVWQPVHSEFL